MVLTKRSGGADWLSENLELVVKADALISRRLSTRKDFCEYTEKQVVDDVMNQITSREQGEAGLVANNSVLLLGEAGSGKTHVVEHCVKRLQEASSSVVVLRASGGAYTTDVECLRHLAAQLNDRLVSTPNSNGSFEEGMEWIRGVLRESFQHASSVVIVLDKLECFCCKTRQTLLYNLFNIAQETEVRLSIICTSEKMDVMDMLEKRIKSRFSMRHVHTFLPSTWGGLIQVLMSRLRLPTNCGLKAAFQKEFHSRLEAALRSKRSQWKHDVDLGRPPSWFLWQCLPLTRLLVDQEVKAPLPAAKRPRRALGSLPSYTDNEVRLLLLDSLSEAEHIALLALQRLHERRATCTMSAVLHEIELLHNGGGLMSRCCPDRYSVAFDRLVQLRLVELDTAGAADLPKRYVSCESLAQLRLAELIKDLGAGQSSIVGNPLRKLPEPVQQWAMKPCNP
mmetsp:Transcript_17861/g.39175  ORF Transcript_17861/g.39175 Transcript_17861/m.39175 type:complete len:452 (-) Transcript_17861:278-1633(-)